MFSCPSLFWAKKSFQNIVLCILSLAMPAQPARSTWLLYQLLNGISRFLSLGAYFSKAPESFWARKAILNWSVSKNIEVNTPETPFMKGTSVSVIIGFKIFHWFRREAPGPLVWIRLICHYLHVSEQENSSWRIRWTTSRGSSRKRVHASPKVAIWFRPALSKSIWMVYVWNRKGIYENTWNSK